VTAALIALVAGLAAAAGTGLVRRYALAAELVDHPNARSSHAVPTPRGGGLAVVLAIAAGCAAGCFVGLVPGTLLATVLFGGGLVAGIGFLDDHRDVPARWRLLVHLAACALAVHFLGPIRELALPGGIVELGWFGVGLSLLAGVSLINLYNFMDGIDGLAGAELVCVCTGLALFGGTVLMAPALLGVAVGLGFLAWNWPPARIFMGDVGSGFLGFLLGALLLAGVAAAETGVFGPLVLLGVFVVDATVTLFTRALTGQRVGEPHRSHAYQVLSRRFDHRTVTVWACAVNLLWLLPFAWVAERFPAWGLPLMVVAWSPLVALAVAVGAGRATD
jgi:Fuc2NAc and GlcNAc transferase